MAPAYGNKNVRWLVEWLEYHKAVGVDAVHIPIWDDEVDKIACRYLTPYPLLSNTTAVIL